MKLNVKQIRRDVTNMINLARKEVQERLDAIKNGEELLKTIDTFTLHTSGGAKKVIRLVSRPNGAIGVSEAIKKVLSPDKGLRMKGIVDGALALNPHTNSADPASSVAATVAGMFARKAIRRKKDSEGLYVYFSKPAKTATKAAA